MIDGGIFDCDEEYYNTHTLEFESRDSILESLYDAVWDDFDVNQFVEDNYEVSELWDAIDRETARGMRDDIYDKAHEQSDDDAYDEWCNVHTTEPNSEFECCGETYKVCTEVNMHFRL